METIQPRIAQRFTWTVLLHRKSNLKSCVLLEHRHIVKRMVVPLTHPFGSAVFSRYRCYRDLMLILCTKFISCSSCARSTSHAHNSSRLRGLWTNLLPHRLRTPRLTLSEWMNRTGPFGGPLAKRTAPYGGSEKHFGLHLVLRILL